MTNCKNAACFVHEVIGYHINHIVATLYILAGQKFIVVAHVLHEVIDFAVLAHCVAASTLAVQNSIIVAVFCIRSLSIV